MLELDLIVQISRFDKVNTQSGHWLVSLVRIGLAKTIVLIE